MKIKKSQLRQLIREVVKETLLVETEMLQIIHNPYENLDTINRIANYALANDMAGALADPEVNHADLDLDLDGMSEWVGHVGDASAKWMSDGSVVPDNWDADLVYDFIKDLEVEWHKSQGKASDQNHASTPGVKEREAIGQALGVSYVLPSDMSSIVYQIRRRGGKPSNINIEDDRSIGNIDLSNLRGTTPDKIIAVLSQSAAKERKKQKSVRHTPPIYD